MDFQQLEGKEYIWKKAKCSSTENGTIVSVNLDGRYLIGKGEDEKQHFFSFDSSSFLSVVVLFSTSFGGDSFCFASGRKESQRRTSCLKKKERRRAPCRRDFCSRSQKSEKENL